VTDNHQVIVYWIISSKKLCINMSRNTNRHAENRAEMPDSFEVKQMMKEKVQFVNGSIGTFLFLNSVESNRIKTLFPRRLNKDCRLVCRGSDKSLALPGRKQATATEDFDFHISYL